MSRAGWVLAGLALVIASSRMFAQSNRTSVSSNQKEYLSADRISPQVRELAEALGERVRQSGKERVVMTGTLRIGGTNTAVRLTTEIPNKTRIDFLGANAKSIATSDDDAKSDKGAVSEVENDQIESLFFDSQDYFLFQSENGQPMRLLGRRFIPDGSNAATYIGPRYDIFELIVLQSKRSDKVRRQKHYYFESSTGLLSQVRYRINKGGKNILVQTEVPSWQFDGGLRIPKQIVRKEDGVEVFRLDIASGVAAAKVADTQFLIP